MRCLAWAAVAAIVVLACGGQAAAKELLNRVYVQSGCDGVFYARCIPASDKGSAGRMEIYRVEADGDKLVDRCDGYPRAVVLAWSPLKGKVAVMAVMRDSKEQEEFHILLGGERLAKYTTDGLLALGAPVVHSRPGGRHADYRVIGEERQPGNSNERDFVIELRDGKRLRFDITTGLLRAAQKE